MDTYYCVKSTIGYKMHKYMYIFLMLLLKECLCFCQHLPHIWCHIAVTTFYHSVHVYMNLDIVLNIKLFHLNIMIHP